MEKLESIFKGKLENHESPVSDVVWREVSKTLLQQKRKKRLFLFLIILFMLATLIGGYYWLNKDISNELPQKEPVRVQTAQIIEEDVNKTSDQKIVQRDIGYNPSKINNNLKNLNLEGINIENTFHKTTSIIDNSIAANEDFLLSDNDDLYSLIPNSNSISNNVHLKIKLRKNYINNVLSRKAFRIERSKYFIHNLKHKTPGILNNCFPTKSNAWFFELFFSPDFNKKSLIGDDTAYINSRLNTEKAAFSFSSGIKIGYKFRNGLVLRSGFDFLIIKEKFHVVIKELISTQTIITIDTINHSDGSIEIVRDTTLKENYNDKNFNNVNSLSMINIPLIFGYEYKQGKNSFGLNMGVIFNLVTNNKAQILNRSNKVVDLYERSNIFNKSLGVAIYNSIYYSRTINSDYDLFVEPKLKYYLKTFTKSNNSLQQKYVNFAFSLGARYHF
jgi:uncharacterized protein YneF (UPF0154 family)